MAIPNTQYGAMTLNITTLRMMVFIITLLNTMIDNQFNGII